MIDPRHVALLAGTALATLAAPAFAQDTDRKSVV